MDRQERWLSVAEIAEHIGIKQETVLYVGRAEGIACPQGGAAMEVRQERS
jgi:hypothetical protein